MQIASLAGTNLLSLDVIRVWMQRPLLDIKMDFASRAMALLACSASASASHC